MDYRGTCSDRHYIRADALEKVVKLELGRLASLLRYDEETLSEILPQKTNAELLKEKQMLEDALQKAVSRDETVAGLYEKVYEDNATGKVTDEWFIQLSRKYEVERDGAKGEIRGPPGQAGRTGQQTVPQRRLPCHRKEVHGVGHLDSSAIEGTDRPHRRVRNRENGQEPHPTLRDLLPLRRVYLAS